MGERKRALIEAAEFAEFYAQERMTLAGDAILHDPLLRGQECTPETMAKSRGLQIDGTINSAAYHAAMQIAQHLRDLASQA